MDQLVRLCSEYGALLVFVVVLVEQLGAPIPAYPVLLLTGGLAARGQLAFASLLAAAVLASVLADTVWYLAGRRYGPRVLGLLCKVSLTPDGCVRQMQGWFIRWGAASLLGAKFVPGFASIATAVAGAMKVPRPAFLAFDAAGAALWAGVGLAVGAVFADVVDQVVQTFEEFGRWGILLIVFGLVAFVTWKWWQRRRFAQQLRMTRITVEALSGALERGERILIIDARSPGVWADERISGAIHFGSESFHDAAKAHPRDALVVVYCSCPNDASAVVTARKLLASGFEVVRPLAGGIDAWRSAGGSLA